MPKAHTGTTGLPRPLQHFVSSCPSATSNLLFFTYPFTPDSNLFALSQLHVDRASAARGETVQVLTRFLVYRQRITLEENVFWLAARLIRVHILYLILLDDICGWVDPLIKGGFAKPVCIQSCCWATFIHAFSLHYYCCCYKCNYTYY